MLARCLILAAVLVGGALAPPAGAQDPPSVPQGVEVQARGPVHEAYASPTTEPVAAKPIPKQPPAAIEELPPAEKPEGDVVWISGYWAWDDDRSDFLWVSGVWRKSPPGRQWVAGYWREEGSQWQWVPGFWTAAAKKEEQQITYLPSPPATPEVAAPGKPPTEESFYVPGAWVWNGDRYVWRAGYWARIQPGYVWVPDHYRWTPSGYVYVPGYWDLALKSRGILYAPVIISPAVVTVGWTYTPAYAVRDTVVVEAMFVRPGVCHYYFGDYYGPTYRTLGFESCVVYSRRRYDPIIVYEVYERRDPAWVSVQINVFNDRYAGRAPVPPRTLVQQQTIVNNVTNTTIVNNNTTVVNNSKTVVNNNMTMIAPTKQVAATKNTTLVKLDDTTRNQARAQAAVVQQVAKQRTATEVPTPPGAPRQARVANLNVPKTEPVKPGMKVPAAPAAASLDRPRPPVPAAGATKPAAAGATKVASTPGAATGKTAPVATKQAPGAARPGTAQPQPGARWLPAVPGRPGAPAPGLPLRRPPPKDDKDKKKDRQ